MSFHRSIHVKKTRRTRRCNWCWEWINKGEPSVATSGVCDGDFYQGRYHPECDDAVSRWYAANKCWGDELPEDPMNRGGIEPRGEPEETPLDTVETLKTT